MKMIIYIYAFYLYSYKVLANEEFPKMPNGFRIGMEREVDKIAFSKIIHFFNFENIQGQNKSVLKKYLSEKDIDEYIELAPEKRLAEFPQGLREKLTNGLKLESVLDIAPSTVLTSNASNAPTVNSKLILPFDKKSGGELQDKIKEKIVINNVDSKSEKIYDQALRRAEWEKLNARWRSLPIDEKINVIQVDNLRPITKADLAIKYYSNHKSLPLKKDVPKEIAELFDKFTWGKDLDMMEFRHKDELIISTPQDFYNDLISFAKLTGTSKELLEPEKLHKEKALLQKNLSEPSYAKGSSMHYHISIPNYKMKEIAKAFNDKIFLERVGQGIESDLTRKGHFLYQPLDLSEKGLLKLVNFERIEFRSHPTNILDELKFNLKALSLGPVESLSFVKDKIYQLMTNENLFKILIGNEGYFKYILKNYPIDDNQLKNFFKFVLDKIKLSKNEVEGKKIYSSLEKIYLNNDVFKSFFLSEENLNNLPNWLLKERILFNENLLNEKVFKLENAAKISQFLNDSDELSDLHIKVEKILSIQPEEVVFGNQKSQLIEYLIQNANLKTLNAFSENFSSKRGTEWSKFMNSEIFAKSAVSIFLKSSDFDKSTYFELIVRNCFNKPSTRSCSLLNIFLGVVDKDLLKFAAKKISMLEPNYIKDELILNLIKRINKEENSMKWIEAKKNIIELDGLDFKDNRVVRELLNPQSLLNEPVELTRSKLYAFSYIEDVENIKLIAQYLDFPDELVRKNAIRLIAKIPKTRFEESEIRNIIRKKLIIYATKKYNRDEINLILEKMKMNYNSGLIGYEVKNSALKTIHAVRSCSDYYSALDDKLNLKNIGLIGSAVATSGIVFSYKDELKDWLKNLTIKNKIPISK